jgi:hypothetical protein
VQQFLEINQRRGFMGIRAFVAVVAVCVATVAPARSGDKEPKHGHASISGVVTGASAVMVTLSGPVTFSTTTDASGAYTFTGLRHGSYTVTASKAGYAFSPASLAVEVKGSRQITGLDFAGAAAWNVDATTWSFCRLEENMPQDEWESFTFIGGTLFRTQLEYASTDSSCTGEFHGNVENAWSAAYALGGDAAATLDAGPVTARSLELLTEDGSLFSGMLYVETAREPDELHLGVDGVPELWPRAYVKEAAQAVSVPALQGIWDSCATFDTGDFREVFTVNGYRILVSGTRYSSSDGSCSGSATPEFEEVVSFVLRGTTPATLDGGIVLARAADAVFASGRRLYSTMYLDTTSTPHVLYVGDETADPARDGSTPDSRPIALQQWRPRVKQP